MEAQERVQIGLSTAEIVEENLGLVWKVVHHFEGCGIEQDDLFQTGCLGLIKAAQRFDASRGLQFSTYAFPNIVGEIKTAIRDNSSMRVSRSLKTLAMQAKRMEQIMQQELGRAVCVEELAFRMNCSREDLVSAISAYEVANDMLPFESTNCENEDDFAWENVVASEEDEEDWATTIDLNEQIDSLTGRERLLFKMRFFDGETQAKVAEVLGMSQAQVSRLEKGVLLSVREALSGRGTG